MTMISMILLVQHLVEVNEEGTPLKVTGVRDHTDRVPASGRHSYRSGRRPGRQKSFTDSPRHRGIGRVKENSCSLHRCK